MSGPERPDTAEYGLLTEEQRQRLSAALIARGDVYAVVGAMVAQAWEEGFDAGERDVWEHEQAGWPDKQPCIPNPYRTAPIPPGSGRDDGLGSGS